MLLLRFWGSKDGRTCMSKAVLVATDLRHGFGNGFELSIPHLTLEASRSTMILGPNGAGKSILLKIL